jgi:CHAT domain-containing protein
MDHRWARGRFGAGWSGVSAAIVLCLAAWLAAGTSGLAAQRARPTMGEPSPAASAPGSAAEQPKASGDTVKPAGGDTASEATVAPPRSIADITAVLDREKPDPAKVAAAKAIADKQPPGGGDQAAEAAFYYERGTAAGELGRGAQQLADYQKAVELITPLRASNADEYLSYRNLLALALAREGRLRDSIDIRLGSIGFAETTPRVRGTVFQQYYSLVADYVRIGDMAAATAWLTKAENLLQEVPNWKGRARTRLNFLRSRVDWARAYVRDGEGKYAEGESFFRKSIEEQNRSIEEAKNWGDKAPAPGVLETARDYAERDLGLNLARQGRLIDAEIEVRRALLSQLHRRGRYATESAQFVMALGFVVTEQGRYAEAEKLQRVAADTLVSLGHQPGSFVLANARRGLADVLVAEQRWTEALQQYDLIRNGLASDPSLLRRMIGHNLNYADAAVHARRFDAALQVAARTAEGRAKTLGEKHYNTAEARGFHGLVLAATGKPAEALREYAAAIPILLQGSRQTVEDESEGTGRENRLHRILEGYLTLLAEQRGGGDAVAEAFRIADAARGRSVQRALAASAARGAVGDPALADLARRDQDALREISGLNTLISSVLALPSDQQQAASVEALRKRVDDLRTARATIREQIEKRFPDYVNLIDPKPATLAQAQAALRPGEAMIATYVAEDRTYVWAVPKQGPIAFAEAPLKEGELAAMVKSLRQALEPNAATLGEIPRFDVALAYKLYTLLLKPVESGWKGAKSLLVVPHGPLGQLPLGLLVTAAPSLAPEKDGQLLFSPYRKIAWLVRDVAITQLPSVASLATLRAGRAGQASRRPFVGFGDPWFSAEEAAEAKASGAGTQVAQLQTRGASTLLAVRGVRLRRRSAPNTEAVGSAELAQLPRLPDTAEEVREVALALKADPKADVFLGAAANEGTVRSMKLDDRRVVMFATHGLVPGDLNGLVEPALALTAPQVAGVDGDGLLTMSKILGLKLNADWVVLSACNTAAGNGAGAEAVSGLGLAFFYAGTRAMLVSNWPVETTSARTITTDLFRRQAEQAGLSRAEALRQAMLALIDGPGYLDGATKQPLFSYAHPIFWAPFSLVGDGS